MLPRRRSIATVVLIIACFALCTLCFTACQVAAPLALTSTSMGVAYYYMNVTEKTCVYDLDTMKMASLSTLERMGFTVGDQSKDQDGKCKIKATTDKLNITIKLKRITPKCTKIKVNAIKDVFIKDKATSAEIIMQTEKTAELMAVR
jgi:hypothetical protein